MEHWICVTCGTQFAPSQEPPLECPICLDPRQYVEHDGQKWTTQNKLHNDGLRNKIQELEPGLTGIGSTPSFAIGERAILIQTEQGNVLWDCISLLDNETIQAVAQLGGIDAIAISHPHFYTSMIDWANAFDAIIYLHEADKRWVMRPDERITFWTGETQPLLEDITLIRLGGHFAGSTVLHWASGTGFLLTGDTIQVVADRNYVSFMYSYPNNIPLPASKIASMRDIVAQYDFERLYGGWFPSVVRQDARNAVRRSADRYIRALDGAFV